MEVHGGCAWNQFIVFSMCRMLWGMWKTEKDHALEHGHKRKHCVVTCNAILESVKAFSVVPKHLPGTSFAESSSFQVSKCQTYVVFPLCEEWSSLHWANFLRGAKAAENNQANNSLSKATFACSEVPLSNYLSLGFEIKTMNRDQKALTEN